MIDTTHLDDKIMPTLNKMGYSNPIIDQPYSQTFIDHLKQSSQPHILEIGSGYGTTATLALSAGASVVANDLDINHLEILKKNTHEDFLPHLTLNVGKFPQKLTFPSNHFDAILMSQVLHFLTSKEIEQGLPLLKDWLKPGGKVFITAISPYIGVLKRFLLVYLERKKQGSLWPGQIQNLQAYCTHPCRDFNPNFIHVFDPDILRYHLTQAGFKVEKTDYYSTQQNVDDEFKQDGREYVGIIASKLR